MLISHKTVSFVQRTVVLGSKEKQAVEEPARTGRRRLRAPPNSLAPSEQGTVLSQAQCLAQHSSGPERLMTPNKVIQFPELQANGLLIVSFPSQ